MTIKPIHAKTILSRTADPNGWFAARYNMNIYRGCEHRCIYCDSRSDCYQIADFDHELLVKVNAIELLEKELPRKRVKGTISTGAMTDPYTPAEKQFELTRKALQIVDRFGFGIHITTKSDLITRDVDLLQSINRVRASVSFTLTTTDDELARQVEPGAPSPSRRLEAMARLAEAGIHVGVAMMPILPFIEDSEENIRSIVRRAGECGARFILPWFGMSLRSGSREYYYDRLDAMFPGLRTRYEKTFGNQYECPAQDRDILYRVFADECAHFGILHDMAEINASFAPRQLGLFEEV